MQIFIKTLAGSVITVDVSQDGMILDIKKAIEEKEGVPCDKQRLVFNQKTLQDGALLMACGIEKESTLGFYCSMRGGMHHETSSRQDYVKIRIYFGTAEFLIQEVSKFDTFDEIKQNLTIHPLVSERFNSKHFLNPESYDLVWNTIVLKSDKTIEDCGFSDMSVLTLALRT